MEEADLPAVVRVHRKAFVEFFLTRMGPGFLQVYYGTVLSYDRSVSLVAQQHDGEIIGFITGFRDPKAFYAHLRKRRIKLIPATLAAVIRQPSLLRQVLRNAGRVSSFEPPEPRAGLAELSSVGASVQGSGVGSALVSEFCQRMFRAGAQSIALTTDESNNDRARTFYTRHGFILSGRERRGDRVLCVYTLTLSNDVDRT